MRLYHATLALGLVALTSLAPAAERGAGWHSDYEKAQAAAKEQGKPLLVHFYADWCGPCQAMERTILHTPEVLKELQDGVVAVKINADHRKDLAARLGVAALPTDVFVGPDGKVLSREVGSPGKQGYVKRIAQVAARFAPAEQDEDEDIVVASAESDQGRESLAGPGLNGFSPVSLVKNRVWERGSAEFAAEHEGIVYHMASAEELKSFRDEPSKYAPKLKGNDPYLLSMRGQVVAGSIQYGAFFQGQLYLLSSKSNRDRFKVDPQRYTRTVNVMLTDRTDGRVIH